MFDIREFLQEALDFLESRQNPNTIISAVVHMDEKTPHMHLSFRHACVGRSGGPSVAVPLTEDGRLHRIWAGSEAKGNEPVLHLTVF